MLVTHAMMASGDYLSCFADHLAARGLDAFVLDFRGHGASGLPASVGRAGLARPPAADWTFEDYVRQDLPAAIAHVRAVSPAAARGLGYVGHSLGGLAGLAFAGTRGDGAGIDRIVLVAVSLWRRALAPRRARWLRDATMGAFALAAAVAGRVPARRLRLGTEDEPRSYARALARWHFTSRWDSPDGVDYARALADVRVPALVVWSAGDRLASGRDVADIADRLGRAPERLRLEGLDHFGLLRDERARPAWDRIAKFLCAW